MKINDYLRGLRRKLLTLWVSKLLNRLNWKWRLTFIITSLVIIVMLIAWIMSDRQKIFTLKVNTEIIEITILDPLLSEWSLNHARLITDPFSTDSSGTVLADRTVLIPNTETNIKIQRHGVELARLLLTASDEKSVGRIENMDGQTTELGDWALFLISVDNKPLVIPFRGSLTIGDDVTVGVDSMLLSGTVSIVEEQLLENARYTAGTEILDPGDRIQLIRHDKHNNETVKQVIVDGFVRLEPNSGFSDAVNALEVVAHGQADYVQVERLGSSGYQIHAHRWARFLYDPLIAASTAIIALLVLLLEFFSKCIELMKFQKKQTSQSKNEQEP